MPICTTLPLASIQNREVGRHPVAPCQNDPLSWSFVGVLPHSKNAAAMGNALRNRHAPARLSSNSTQNPRPAHDTPHQYILRTEVGHKGGPHRSVNQLGHCLLGLLWQGENRGPTLGAVPILGLRSAKKVTPTKFAVLSVQDHCADRNPVGLILMQPLPACERIDPAWRRRGIRAQSHGTFCGSQVYSFSVTAWCEIWWSALGRDFAARSQLNPLRFRL